MANVQMTVKQFQQVAPPTFTELTRSWLIPLFGFSGSNHEIQMLTQQLAQATHPRAQEDALNRLTKSVECRLKDSRFTSKQVGEVLRTHLRASAVLQKSSPTVAFSLKALDKRYPTTLLDRHAGKIACGVAATLTAVALYRLYQSIGSATIGHTPSEPPQAMGAVQQFSCFWSTWSGVLNPALVWATLWLGMPLYDNSDFKNIWKNDRLLPGGAVSAASIFGAYHLLNGLYSSSQMQFYTGTHASTCVGLLTGGVAIAVGVLTKRYNKDSSAAAQNKEHPLPPAAQEKEHPLPPAAQEKKHPLPPTAQAAHMRLILSNHDEVFLNRWEELGEDWSRAMNMSTSYPLTATGNSELIEQIQKGEQESAEFASFKKTVCKWIDQPYGKTPALHYFGLSTLWMVGTSRKKSEQFTRFKDLVIQHIAKDDTFIQLYAQWSKEETNTPAKNCRETTLKIYLLLSYLPHLAAIVTSFQSDLRSSLELNPTLKEEYKKKRVLPEEVKETILAQAVDNAF